MADEAQKIEDAKEDEKIKVEREETRKEDDREDRKEERKEERRDEKRDDRREEAREAITMPKVEIKEEKREERDMTGENEAKTKAASIYTIDPATSEGNRESREGFFSFNEKNKEAVHKMEFGTAEERRAGAESWTTQFRELSRSGDAENQAFDIRGESVNLNKK